MRPLILTGGPAVGKTTRGRALAVERDRAASIDVDDIRQLIVAERSPRGPRSGADVGREVLAGEGGAGGDEVGGGAREDDPAAVVAGAGAEVDEPIGVRHDRLVVLDDDDRRGTRDQMERAYACPLDTEALARTACT